MRTGRGPPLTGKAMYSIGNKLTIGGYPPTLALPSHLRTLTRVHYLLVCHHLEPCPSSIVVRHRGSRFPAYSALSQ